MPTKRKLSIITAALLLILTAPIAVAQTPDSTAAPADTSTTASPNPVAAEPDTAPSSEDKPAPKPAKRRGRFLIGPEAGVYFPSAVNTQKTFGKQWSTLGFGIGRLDALSSKGEVSWSVEMAGKKQGQNEVTLIPLGVEFKQALTPQRKGNGGLRPYLGATAGICASRLKAPSEGIRAGIRGTPCATLFFGLQANRMAFIEGRYLTMGKVRGYDFSGFEINAGARF